LGIGPRLYRRPVGGRPCQPPPRRRRAAVPHGVPRGHV